MKLRVHQACEQGTPKGVMRFHKGDYPIEGGSDGLFKVNHDPRPGTGKTSTEVERKILDKMVNAGVAALIEE